MTSVICFSKDRPMQLHAYLESISMFSDIRASDISVLYTNDSRISYEKVKKSFPNVNWVYESDFRSQVWELIQNAHEYIMFGCDDVLFVDYFSTKEVEDFLNHNVKIFGYQVRLGNDFIEQPTQKIVKGGYMLWDWRAGEDGYLYYPWELDCTIYRKADVIDLVGRYLDEMINPNYLESIINTKGKKYIKRPLLCCSNSRIKAICITVNRVQDTHMNDFDRSTNTDIYTLSKIYNDGANKLDVKKIARKKTKKIHVGAEFFILEKPDWNIKTNRKKNILWRMWMLIRNIKYLTTVNLREEQWYSSRAIANKVMDEIERGYHLGAREHD